MRRSCSICTSCCGSRISVCICWSPASWTRFAGKEKDGEGEKGSGLRCLDDVQVKWSGVKTQQGTTPFVDEMYDRLRETLNEYEVIICRWPEYTFLLENVS